MSWQQEVKAAFGRGELEVQALEHSTGSSVWRTVEYAHRTPMPEDQDLLRVVTQSGSALSVTSLHRVYISSEEADYAEDLVRGVSLCRPGSEPDTVKMVEVVERPDWVYDLTVAGLANFILADSGVAVHNCPDRNYRFRPPTHEGTINQFTRVFGYIWEDHELVEFLSRGVDYVNLVPPSTGFNGVDAMVLARSAWREMIIYAAMANALMALSINWVAEEFSLRGDQLIEVQLEDGTFEKVTMLQLWEAVYG